MINYIKYTNNKNNHINLLNSQNYTILNIRKYDGSNEDVFINTNDVFNEIVKLGSKIISYSDNVNNDYISLFSNLTLDSSKKKKLVKLYDDFSDPIRLLLSDNEDPYNFLSTSLFIYIVFNLYKCIISMLGDDWNPKSFIKLVKLLDINQHTIIKYCHLFCIDDTEKRDKKIMNFIDKLKSEDKLNENGIENEELLFIKSILIRKVENIINSNYLYMVTRHTPVYNHSLKSEQPFSKAYSIIGIALNKLILTLMSNDINKYKKCAQEDCFNYFICEKGNHKYCQYHKDLNIAKKKSNIKYNHSEKGKARTEYFNNKQKNK